MATYNINSWTYQIATIAFGDDAPAFVLLNIDPGVDNLSPGDALELSDDFSTTLGTQIQGVVCTCSLSQHRVTPLNPWGFTNKDIIGGSNSNFKLNIDVQGQSWQSWRYINTSLSYLNNNTWASLGYGSKYAGAYSQKDNYFTCPVIIFKNTRSNKYILISTQTGGCELYDEIDPGIVNYDGIPVSLVAVNAYRKQGNRLTVLAEIETDDIVPKTEETDPYTEGGTTGDDETEGTGGTGNFDGTSDAVDFPSLPTLSAVDTGFITLFNPSISELQALANYMWSSGFDLDTFKKLFADPMDCILGLSIVPVNVPSGSSGTVNVGNISTGISMTRASSQYVEVDCGTLNVNEFWGAYLDYDPYTKAEIYLPYIGTHALATDDIMGKAVHVKYHIDVLSGALAAYVKCGDSILYTFIGQCASSIPITGNDWTNVINGVLGIAGSVGTMIATGGASAPLSIPGLASTAVNALKPTVEKSGSMSGTGGMLGVQTPYLILTRPRQALPQYQNVFMGYPSFITRTFSSLTGYTEVESVHLLGMTATEQETSEIETLLKSGVIF